MFLDQIIEPDSMEKELSPRDVYKVVNKDSKIHVFELVRSHRQVDSQIRGMSSY